jgi:DNA-binding transcriptional regulator GbsR (MarR family)
MPHDPALDATRSDFIEQTGLISQAEGLPRIAGRVFGMLIFDGEAVSFTDLATRLQVSRASISTSIRLLEERGLVRRLTRPGDRQDYFELSPNPYATMLEGIRRRTRATRDQIGTTIATLPPKADAVGRLRAYGDFYAALDSAVAVALDSLKNAASQKDHPDEQ